MGKLAQWTSFVFLQVFAFSLTVRAEQIPLKKVWNDISQTSPGIEAASLESQAAIEAKTRSSKHWLPRLYLDARTYQTNDPGTSFIGLIEQRSLDQNDFIPVAINNPDAELYTRGALGLDLPLYEGGMKSSQYELQTHLAVSQQYEADSVKLEQYSLVTRAYGSLGLLEQQKQKLLALKQIIDRLLKSYQIGVRSNPVGYSGLLGLKSLAYRIQGLLIQYEAQSNAYYSLLKEMGFRQDDWSPIFDDAISFTQRYFKNNTDDSSLKIQALKEKALVATEASNMEKARYRPRIGAFAETYIFNGTRDTANGYTAGLYLQWSIFNPADSGTYKEAHLKSMAAGKYSQAMTEKENAERQALEQSINALKDNIALLNESQKILNEQSQVAENLFRNGSINALQFVEVLNRRADLIISQTEAGLNLLDASSNRVLKNRFELPKELSQGKML